MKIWTELRLLGLLRRIAKALEARNSIEKARLDSQASRNLGLPGRRSPKLVDFAVASPQDWNERWLKEHPPEVEAEDA